ncbi:hypothetical protein PoMZ_02957 [Pyricularia oryzae]|uniref:Uncharacterized protein n=1 Tax=Pyricularia oryzae TaxID=318829 RepID=A0A4P7N610_PYROR|nr:hypothetical protein PoMZ_02957 [Pyricularia oryzae]
MTKMEKTSSEDGQDVRWTGYSGLGFHDRQRFRPIRPSNPSNATAHNIGNTGKVGCCSKGQNTRRKEEAHLATPPVTLHGSLATKKDQRRSFLQCSASLSRSNSSPMGQPQPASRTSCMYQSFLEGQHSKLGWSPATALKFSQIQRSTSSDCSTPPNVCGRHARAALISSVDLVASAAVHPDRISSTSPKRGVVPSWNARQSSMSRSVMAEVEKWSKGLLVAVRQDSKSTRIARPTIPLSVQAWMPLVVEGVPCEVQLWMSSMVTPL